jgi:CubicO group peptidase (beta-lactamase class C family)
MRPRLSLLCLIGSLFLPATPGAAAPSDTTYARLAATAAASGLTAGMAIAIVRDGRILWRAEVGEADLETHRPAGPETRFYIASTSKALTGLAVARLAEHGAFGLGTPLARALPAARLPDGLSPDSVTVLDVLTHTHGLGSMGPVSLRMSITGEFESNDQMLALVRAHGLARGGRAYQYSNLSYELAGILLAPEGRDGWKSVVEREVTAPLGMTHTTSFVSHLAESVIAMPHEMGVERIERVRLAKDDTNMGPAGGHFSTAGDLARLLIAEMRGGRIDGRQVIPARVIALTQRPHAAQDREVGAYHRHGWGIGWDLGTYDGDTLIHRFGGFSGYYSHVSFMPEHGIGVVVLVNGGRAASWLADAVANTIYDRLRGRSDAEERFQRSLDDVLARGAEERKAVADDIAKRAARPQTWPLPLDAYAGTYRNPNFGTIAIAREGGGLQASMGAARSAIEVADPAKHQLRVTLLGFGSFLTAAPDTSGRITALEFLNARFERK